MLVLEVTAYITVDTKLMVFSTSGEWNRTPNNCDDDRISFLVCTLDIHMI